MKNMNPPNEESAKRHPLQTLGDKIATNLQGVNLSMKAQANSRLNVVIDWTKGTMVVEQSR